MAGKRILFFFFTIIVFARVVPAQPFASDISTFKKKDSANFPGANKILFVGSSSFTKWTDIKDYFPGYKIINRGFGGSTLPDLIRYANDIIIPYHPKQIVIYCGDNDLVTSDTITSETVFNRFVTLFTMIRKELPKVAIAFVSIKPSPSRWHLKDKMIQANELIKEFLEKQKKTAFIDVYHPMLGADGKPIPEIFLQDNLHMNAKGYAIWKNIIEPYLKK